MTADGILDDLFHGCAWAAYLDQAQAEQGRPDSEATRRRAFRYFEEELAKKNGPLPRGAGPSDGVSV
jgi:hypothetical protein